MMAKKRIEDTVAVEEGLKWVRQIYIKGIKCIKGQSN